MKSELTNYVYRIWDKEKEDYWCNRDNISVWIRKNHAIQSWDALRECFTDTKFSGQSRFVLHRCKITHSEAEEVK